MTDALPVLVVAPQPFYEDRGTPIAVFNVVRALGELGRQVDVLTYPVGRDVELPGVRVLRIANPFGFRHVPIGFSARKVLLDGVLAVALAGRLARTRYRCVHAVEESVFLALALAGRTPVIYDMQSSLPEQLAPHPALGTALAQSVLQRCEQWALRRASRVIASAGLAARVRALAPATPVTEWRFAAEARPRVAGDAGHIRAEFGLPGTGAPVILYAGSFEPYQGLALLLAALPAVLDRYPDAVLVLAGATEGDAVPGGEATGDLRAHLRVLPRLPRAASLRLLAAADVLVSPRAWGANAPLKIFDYLAAGRPIVATDIAAHRAFLTEDRAVLVPPTEAALAGGILAVLGDAARAAALAAGARRFADDQLGWAGFVRAVQGAHDG